jgi:hypothetical protein
MEVRCFGELSVEHRGARTSLTWKNVVFAFFIACTPSPTGAPLPIDANAATTPYPRGAWRLLSWPERDSIVLWVSHILVSHRDARPDPVLRPMGWRPDTPAARSREEARALAVRVAALAEKHPETFEALARENSDDAVTRDAGGSLGGKLATQLPDVYLDALTTLRPGSVSRVIETPSGFEILLRRSRPATENVAGRRIVFRYESTIATQSDDAAPQRSRQEARAMADAMAARVRAEPALFETRARDTSEHADRVLEGNLGTWSTLAPGTLAREVETLAQLRVGEVSAPLDSLFGFEVLERTEPMPAARYAMAAIRLKFGPTLPPDDASSMESVRKEAQSLAAKWIEDASVFDGLEDIEKNASSGRVESWATGHGSPQITAALEKLRIGEITKDPVATPFFFVIARRLDPALVADAAPRLAYDLPLRATPDLGAVVRNASGVLLSQVAADLMRPEVGASLGLNDVEEGHLQSTLQKLKEAWAASKSGEERAAAYTSALRTLSATLSAATYSRFEGFVEEQAARIVLAAP